MPGPPEAEVVPRPKALRRTVAGVPFRGVEFDSRSHRLFVVDQPHGPGSRFATAAQAGAAHGGIAAVNGGFFTPAGDPLGLVVAGGRVAGKWNAGSPLGSGVWFEGAGGHGAIRRRQELGAARAATLRELLQAGPMLVENGQAVGGLETSKRRLRTLVFTDGGTRWWIGLAGPVSLHGLAAALVAESPASRPVRHALNLDGGGSSDLWISAAAEGGPLVERPPWQRPVRNFLVLGKR